MTGGSPVQVVPLSRRGRSARRQPIGYAGLISRPPMAAGQDGGAGSTAADGASQADFAQDEHAGTERMRVNSSDLLSRLPFGDAINLAALVGTGQMSWQDVNIALAARIKLAAAREIRRRTESKRQWDENVGACAEWEEARRTGESEIWARYHARCDAVFADRRGPLDAGRQSIELLFSRERILDRLRDN